jgi:putative acyl-CoA dehydrogenase
MARTHEVVNQTPPLQDHDLLATDVVLLDALRRHGGAAHEARLHQLGLLAGTPQAQQWGRLANTVTPVLRTHDRYGHRVDEVEFHPAWHELMAVATAQGLHGTPWAQPVGSGAHVARAVGFHVWSQVEAGHGCPISMTYAAVPALRTDPAVAAVWEPPLTAPAYEVGLRPVPTKAGAIAGMAMTEKQGGSDVRANTTRAVPDPATGTYRLTGHKWFCSHPMADVFLVLAQAPGGLTCFVLPRVLPDGTRNTLLIQRLKDKLGNRSNASSEIELDDTVAYRLGEEGRGVATIISMVAATRLDCVIGSASLLRAAVAQATWHAAHRVAFGAPLADQPVMTQVLADLALESEAATMLAVRLAATFDSDDRAEAALRRIALPPAKYWVTKRSVAAVGEALECLGGNGYAEEGGMPRLYREAPVNAVWEGSGNVQAIDLLRVLAREPEAVQALQDELATATGAGYPTYDKAVVELTGLLAEAAADPASAAPLARALAGRVATLLQASLLVRHSPPEAADAFVATRLEPRPVAETGLAGAVPVGSARTLVTRATPRTGQGG